MVLKRVQDIYSSATFIHGLFVQAIEKLTSPQYASATTPHLHFPQQHSSSGDSTSQAALLPMDSFWQFDDEMSEFWDSLPTLSGQTIEDSA